MEDTKKAKIKKISKVVWHVILYIWTTIKCVCVGFVVSTLTFVFTSLFCKSKAQKAAAMVGAMAIGTAATTRIAHEDKNMGELADDILEIYENIKAKKEAEASENVVTE